jgi:surface protein
MTLMRVKMRQSVTTFVFFLCSSASIIPRFIEAAATRAGSSALTFKIRNNNIRKAVRLWMSDRTTARRVYGPIESWDTSSVTSMDSLFLGAEDFSEDISAWDVSNVRSMQWIFYNSHNFTADVSGWDVSKVADMTMAFAYSKHFKADVSSWDTSSVTSLWYTFAYSSSVNANISSWNTASVTSMAGTFQHSAELQPGDTLRWDTTNVEDMTHVLSNATWFKHVVCWNLTKVSAESLEQAYCDAKGGGGFDCNCVPPNLRGSINSECFFPSPACAREVAMPY